MGQSFDFLSTNRELGQRCFSILILAKKSINNRIAIIGRNKSKDFQIIFRAN